MNNNLFFFLTLSNIFNANLSLVVFPALLGINEKHLSSPTQVKIYPAKRFFFKLDKFFLMNAIVPIVSDVNTIL